MSNATSQLRLFNQSEFSRSGKVDRIYMYIMQPSTYQLTPKEHQYYDLLKRAFIVVSEQSAHLNTAVKILMGLENCTREQAYKYISDMEDLFGRVRPINKDFERRLRYDQVSKQMEIALSHQNGDLALKCIDRLIKIGHLDQNDVDDFDPSKFEIPLPVYSDDPNDAFEEAGILEDDDAENFEE